MANPDISGCTNLKTIFTGKFTQIQTNTSLRRLDYVLLPQVSSCSNWPFRGGSYLCIDFGYCTSSLNSVLNYSSTSIYILRGYSIPYLARNISGAFNALVFVQPSMVASFQEHEYWGLETIAAIGGQEWQDAFSDAANPASEYANVEVYAPDMYDWYVEEYEKAKSAQAT